MSRGRIEDERPKKIEFGLDQICPSCKGRGVKNKHECWSCHGTGVYRKERDDTK